MTIVPPKRKQRPVSGDLSELFGIDLEEPQDIQEKPEQKKTVRRRKVNKTISAKGGACKIQGIEISHGIRASHIIQLREDLNLDQHAFADLIGKSPDTVINWENQRGILKLQSTHKAGLQKLFSLVEQAREALHSE